MIVEVCFFPDCVVLPPLKNQNREQSLNYALTFEWMHDCWKHSGKKCKHCAYFTDQKNIRQTYSPGMYICVKLHSFETAFSRF